MTNEDRRDVVAMSFRRCPIIKKRLPGLKLRLFMHFQRTDWAANYAPQRPRMHQIALVQATAFLYCQ